MTSNLIDGKKLAEKVRKNLKKEIDGFKKKPELVVILVGENPSSQIYVRNKIRYAKEVGIKSDVIKFSDDVSEKHLLKTIEKLNKNKKVSGILVQLPLPKHIDEFKVINCIKPEKDVDGFTVKNKGLLMLKKPRLVPCTPLGIMDILKSNKVNVAGKLAVVVGRSDIVGKPMAQLLLNSDATVVQCHSKTKNLSDVTSKADILISAVGKRNLITGKHVKNGAVVIDVAMIRDEKNKKWIGDVNFEQVSKKAKLITPVPGGVGPMTVAMLLKNTVDAYKQQNNKNKNEIETF